MEFLSIQEQVMALFADLPAFARMTANLTMEDYPSKRYDFFQYPLGISWLGIPRNQASSLREAFAALFLLDLHYQNDWIYSEAARTNADQFVIDRVPADQWVRLLQNKWIADYFDLPRRQPRVVHQLRGTGSSESCCGLHPMGLLPVSRCLLRYVLRADRGVLFLCRIWCV